MAPPVPHPTLRLGVGLRCGHNDVALLTVAFEKLEMKRKAKQRDKSVGDADKKAL